MTTYWKDLLPKLVFLLIKSYRILSVVKGFTHFHSIAENSNNRNIWLEHFQCIELCYFIRFFHLQKLKPLCKYTNCEAYRSIIPPNIITRLWQNACLGMHGPRLQWYFMQMINYCDESISRRLPCWFHNKTSSCPATKTWLMFRFLSSPKQK